MQFQAVIIPPDEVLQSALEAAYTISVAPEPLPEEEPPGLLQKLFRRNAPHVEPEPLAVTVIPSPMMFVRMANFGNVTVEDTRTLARVLSEAATVWPAPVLYVDHLELTRTDAQLAVTAVLGGDTGAMGTVFRNLVDTARPERFFLDRRSYRPEFAVATITLPDDPATWERLESDVAEAYRGMTWQAKHLSLLKTTIKDGARNYFESSRVALGSEADSHTATA